MDKVNILLIDDDEKLSQLLAEFLQANQFAVSQAYNTKQADQQLANSQPNLLLLDIMMPSEDGISYCRRIRQSSNLPIIMLTAVDNDVDQIVAHEVGADDYVTKPYNMRILLVKIKAVLRRYQYQLPQAIDTTELVSEKVLQYCFNDWNLNTGNHQLTTADGTHIELSSAEYRLLLAFIEHPRRVLTRDQLLYYTQGDDALVYDRSIDVIISRLRQKIEIDSRHPSLVKTMRNAGYMFDVAVKKQYINH